VIVDEAARCNPLDLMIPMSVARRRVVLVGDHRQLPHILEPGVERELKKSCSEETREALEKSLFESLVNHLRALEAADGISRYVRLDRQYRMPPSLGKFVSDAFYAPYGEGFESGRPETDLQHDFPAPYAGKRGIWVDVPVGDGAESGRKSKRRPAEAERIGTMVKELLQNRPDLSVGVITFYADQVNEIQRELARHSILEERTRGEYQPDSGWRSTLPTADRGSRDRIKVGTVDAFQGLEFDVVFLSLVRSNRLSVGADHRAWLAKFGFLLVENRVCVAMSRQERILFVVGDSKMFIPEDRAPQPGLRQLRDFYLNFCGGTYGLRV
jgi:superfamily I DNA and/or RNA helicase